MTGKSISLHQTVNPSNFSVAVMFSLWALYGQMEVNARIPGLMGIWWPGCCNIKLLFGVCQSENDPQLGQLSLLL